MTGTDRTRWRALWAGVLGVLCLVGLAQLVGVRELYLAAAFCLAPIAGLLLNRPPRDVVVEVPELIRGTAGEPVRHAVGFRNSGTRTVPPCRVVLRSRGLSDAELWCPQLRPGERADAETIRTALARGIASTHEMRIVGTGLGGGYHPVETAVDGRIVVHPHVAEPLTSTTDDLGDDGRSLIKGGHEISGIRQWSPGDSRRGIHWRATARHDTLVVADREQPLADAFQALVVAEATDEQALARLAAGALVALRSGRPVHVVHVDGGRVGQAPTLTSTLLLDWVSALPAEGAGEELPDVEAVAALLPGRDVWVLSPAGRYREWLAALAARVQVVEVSA